MVDSLHWPAAAGEVARLHPWVLVVSEYLDLAYLLRQAGVPALTARSVPEALQCLEHWTPRRVVLDPTLPDWHRVLAHVSALPETVPVELYDQVLDRLLAS